MTRTAHNNSQTISLLEHRSLEPKYNVRSVQKKRHIPRARGAGWELGKYLIRIRPHSA